MLEIPGDDEKWLEILKSNPTIIFAEAGERQLEACVRAVRERGEPTCGLRGNALHDQPTAPARVGHDRPGRSARRGRIRRRRLRPPPGAGGAVRRAVRALSGPFEGPLRMDLSDRPGHQDLAAPALPGGLRGHGRPCLPVGYAEAAHRQAGHHRGPSAHAGVLQARADPRPGSAVQRGNRVFAERRVGRCAALSRAGHRAGRRSVPLLRDAAVLHGWRGCGFEIAGEHPWAHRAYRHCRPRGL